MAKRLIVAAFLGIIVILLYNNALNITASPQQVATSQVAEQRRAVKRLIKIAKRAIDNIHTSLITRHPAARDVATLATINKTLDTLDAVVNQVDDTALATGNALDLACNKITQQLIRLTLLSHKQQECACRFIHKPACTLELNKKWTGARQAVEQTLKSTRQLQLQLTDPVN